MKREIKLERDHIKTYHEEEMKELKHLLIFVGIPGSWPHLDLDTNERVRSGAKGGYIPTFCWTLDMFGMRQEKPYCHTE